MRRIIKTTVRSVVERLVPNKRKQHRLIKTPATPTNVECYRHAVTKFRTDCFNFTKVCLLLCRNCNPQLTLWNMHRTRGIDLYPWSNSRQVRGLVANKIEDGIRFPNGSLQRIFIFILNVFLLLVWTCNSTLVRVIEPVWRRLPNHRVSIFSSILCHTEIHSSNTYPSFC